MKILGLRKVLYALIFGCISSVVLLLIELKGIYQYIEYDIYLFITMVFLHVLLFSIAFLYVFLLIQLIKGNYKEENDLKTLERLVYGVENCIV